MGRRRKPRKKKKECDGDLLSSEEGAWAIPYSAIRCYLESGAPNKEAFWEQEREEAAGKKGRQQVFEGADKKNFSSSTFQIVGPE